MQIKELLPLLVFGIMSSLLTVNLLWAGDGADIPTVSSISAGGILLNPTPILGEGEWFDVDSQQVMPFARPNLPTACLILHGNGFFEAMAEEGVARGGADFAAPNMFAADLGSTLDDRQYLNLNVILTSDLWTLAPRGSLQLLQIGGVQNNGQPFLDASQPNSTPLMGLTLSDTFSLADDKSALKLFAAPRGESTDGPIDYMHRITGAVNPDRPLGQFVGQDAGLITSSVLGESLKLGGFHIESSVFNGALPNSSQVDLPLGPINSLAVRLIEEFSPQMMLMASYAWVGTPQPGVANDQRYSVSLYTHIPITDSWTLHDTFIFGGVTNIDNTSSLNSFLEEILLNNSVASLFARFEMLQRTPNELAILGMANGDTGQWVNAVTLGYTHQVVAWDGWELRAGLSVSNDQLPTDYQTAYAGNPFTYKFFFQLGGAQAYKL